MFLGVYPVEELKEARRGPKSTKEEEIAVRSPLYPCTAQVQRNYIDSFHMPHLIDFMPSVLSLRGAGTGSRNMMYRTHGMIAASWSAPICLHSQWLTS